MTFKKTIAAAVTAALLVTGPGYPISQALAQNVAGQSAAVPVNAGAASAAGASAAAFNLGTSITLVGPSGGSLGILPAAGLLPGAGAPAARYEAPGILPSADLLPSASQALPERRISPDLKMPHATPDAAPRFAADPALQTVISNDPGVTDGAKMGALDQFFHRRGLRTGESLTVQTQGSSEFRHDGGLARFGALPSAERAPAADRTTDGAGSGVQSRPNAVQSVIIATSRVLSRLGGKGGIVAGLGLGFVINVLTGTTGWVWPFLGALILGGDAAGTQGNPVKAVNGATHLLVAIVATSELAGSFWLAQALFGATMASAPMLALPIFIPVALLTTLFLARQGGKAAEHVMYEEIARKRGDAPSADDSTDGAGSGVLNSFTHDSTLNKVLTGIQLLAYPLLGIYAGLATGGWAALAGVTAVLRGAGTLGFIGGGIIGEKILGTSEEKTWGAMLIGGIVGLVAGGAIGWYVGMHASSIAAAVGMAVAGGLSAVAKYLFSPKKTTPPESGPRADGSTDGAGSAVGGYGSKSAIRIGLSVAAAWLFPPYAIGLLIGMSLSLLGNYSRATPEQKPGYLTVIRDVFLEMGLGILVGATLAYIVPITAAYSLTTLGVITAVPFLGALAAHVAASRPQGGNAGPRVDGSTDGAGSSVRVSAKPHDLSTLRPTKIRMNRDGGTILLEGVLGRGAYKAWVKYDGRYSSPTRGKTFVRVEYIMPETARGRVHQATREELQGLSKALTRYLWGQVQPESDRHVYEQLAAHIRTALVGPRADGSTDGAGSIVKAEPYVREFPGARQVTGAVSGATGLCRSLASGLVALLGYIGALINTLAGFNVWVFAVSAGSFAFFGLNAFLASMRERQERFLAAVESQRAVLTVLPGVISVEGVLASDARFGRNKILVVVTDAEGAKGVPASAGGYDVVVKVAGSAADASTDGAGSGIRADNDFSSQAAFAERTLLNKVYGWMTLGLGLTAAVAWAAVQSGLAATILANPAVFIGLAVLELAIVIGLSWKLRSLSPGAALAGFLFYSAVNGAFLAPLLALYTVGSVAAAFVVSAGMFGAMALYGHVTKKDLNSVGAYGLMALIGLILASLVNMFLRSTGLDLILTYASIVIFLGLTAYDTQKIKEMAAREGRLSPDDVGRFAVLGALNLYLDFINIFLNILKLIGKAKSK